MESDSEFERRQEEEAAAEAAHIGGEPGKVPGYDDDPTTPGLSEDPALRPVQEAGGGEAPNGGTYPDKNRIAHVVVPGEPQYAALKAGKEIAPVPSATNGATRPRPAPIQAKPAWQQEAPAAQAKPAAATAGPAWLKA